MPPQDSGVQFDNQGDEYGAPPERGGMDLSGVLVKWGIVSSPAEAQYVLLGAAVLILLIAAYFLFHSGGSMPPVPGP